MQITINYNSLKYTMAGNNDPKSPLPSDSNDDPNYDPNPDNPVTPPPVVPSPSPKESDDSDE